MEQFDLKKKLFRNFLLGVCIFGFISLFLYLGGWKIIMHLVSAKYNDDYAITQFFGFLMVPAMIISVIPFFWKYNRWTEKHINKQEQNKAGFLVFFNLILIGAIGFGSISLFETIAPHYLYENSTQESIQAKNDDEYEDLGNISVYHENISDHSKIDNEPLNGDYHLFMKSHGGENFYYVGLNYKSERKHLLERGSWTKDGKHFNARYYWNPINCYVNVPSWSTSSSSGSGSTRVIHDDSPRAVQEWVPCPVCGNSGRVGLCQHCNGTGQDLYYTRDYRDCPSCGGLKKCTVCGGNGGHYETRYR